MTFEFDCLARRSLARQQRNGRPVLEVGGHEFSYAPELAAPGVCRSDQ